MNELEQAIWNDFVTYSKTYAQVKSMLISGKNVVAVLLDGVIGLGAYETDPLAAVMKVKNEMVGQGAPLPIGDDNLPTISFIVWRSTDQIDQPEQLSTAALAGRVFDGYVEVKKRWFDTAKTQP